MKKVKIVADSSCDMNQLEDIAFETAPLKIITDKKEYVDDKNLDVSGMVTDLQSYRGKSSTSCPNPEDWIKAFGDADEIYCITITGTLSGSYNSACTAKQIYEENNPDKKVFVLNSLTTGPEMGLIIEKIKELVSDNICFEDICEKINEYSQNTGLLFMLESMRNLANNGRVSPFVAKAAGILGIRVVGKASDKGDLEPLNKCRGEKKAVDTVFEQMKKLGYSGGKVKISHCFNDENALKLKEKIENEFSGAKLTIDSCGGLCSFYAEKGGMLIGFEKA